MRWGVGLSIVRCVWCVMCVVSVEYCIPRFVVASHPLTHPSPPLSTHLTLLPHSHFVHRGQSRGREHIPALHQGVRSPRPRNKRCRDLLRLKEVLEWCRGSLVPLFPGPPPLLRLLGPLPPNQNPARMTSKDCGVLYTLRCVLYTCVLNCSTGSTATASLDVCPRTPLTESGRCSFG